MYTLSMICDYFIFLFMAIIKNKSGYALKIFLMVLYCIIVANRVNTPDLEHYENWYKILGQDIPIENLAVLSFISKENAFGINMEFGNILLFHFGNYLSLTFAEFSFFWTMISTFIFFYYVKKICMYYNLYYNFYHTMIFFVPIYGVFFQLIAIRQGMSIVFLMGGFYYLITKRWFKMIVTFFVAAAFHTSVFIIFPILVLINLLNGLEKKIYILVSLIPLLFIFIGLDAYFSGLSKWFVNVIAANIPMYESYGYGQNDVAESISIVRIITAMLIFFISLFYVRKNEFWKIYNVILLVPYIMLFLGSLRISQRIYDTLFVFVIVIGTEIIRWDDSALSTSHVYIIKCGILVLLLMKMITGLRVAMLI